MAFMETGFIGNVWIAQNVLPQKGMKAKQHSHKHDHASLLVSGKAQVQIGDSEPKIFEAPTFIVIKADYDHEFTALEDNTVWYCVFALRDLNGNVLTQADPANIPNLDLVMNSTIGEVHYRYMYEDVKQELTEAHQLIDKLREKIRVLRSGLLVKSDWDEIKDSIQNKYS